MNRAAFAVPSSLLFPAACVLLVGCGERPARAAADDRSPPQSLAAVDNAMLTALPRDSLEAMGAAAYGDARYDEARAIWELGLELTRREGDVEAEAGLLTSLGLVAWRLGEFERGERLQHEALRVEHGAGLIDLLPRTYNALGLIAWDQGRFSIARDWYDSTFAAAEIAGDDGYYAKALVNLGNVETALGEVESARRLMRGGLERFQTLEMPDMESRTLVNLAALERDAGNLTEALDWANQGLALARSIGDGVGEEAAFGQLATLHMRLGDHEAAYAAADSALQLARRHGLRQAEAADLEILADLHRQLGDLQRALRLYDSARAINAELALSVEMGLDLYRLADVHAAMGNFDLSLARAKDALAIHRASGASLAELADLLLLAEVAELHGDGGKAEAWLDEAARLSGRLALRSGRVEVALAAARIADRRGDTDRVLEVIAAVEDELPLAGFAAESEGAAFRARAHLRKGQLAAAEQAGRTAIELVGRARDNLGSGLLRSTLAHSRAGMYADLVEVLLRQGRMEEGFEVAVAAGPAGPQVIPRGEDPADILRERIGALTAQIRSLERDYPESPELAEEPAERLLAVRKDYAASVNRAVDSNSVAVRVKAALGADEALLQFLVGDDQVFGFVVTPDGVVGERLATKPETLVSRVRVARQLLGSPTHGETRDDLPVLAILYEDLIEPLRKAGGLDRFDRLIIVPHGPLTYLPFAALRNQGAGRWLAEEKVIAHLPSAALVPARRRLADGAARHASAFAPFPAELPASRGETRAVAAALGDGTSVELGDRATEPAVRAALSASGIVHVASHAELNAANPLLSAIVLAASEGRSSDGDRDGRLEVRELIELPIRSSLVFLSGCETGVGAGWSSSYSVGEDFATLERAFLDAGAGDVVATLWRIEDESAAEFASRFYNNLRDADPATALIAAQRQMIADDRFSDPFHWAAYRTSGGGR